MLPEFERANEELRHAYALNPSAEIAAQITNHDAFIEELRQRLANLQDSQVASADSSKSSCDRSFGIDANAAAGAPGATASADADWSKSGTCSNTTANLYAYAYARVTSNGVTVQHAETCSELNKTSYNCPLRSASVSGSGDCYSYANAYVYVPAWGGYVEQLTRSNSSCGAPPQEPPCGDGICEIGEFCFVDCERCPLC